VATAPGTGSIAVIRVSGDRAFTILDRFFPDRPPSRQRSHTVRLNWFTSADRSPIDQVMLTVFRAPRSYTGEDMAEISCHGGTVAADAVLNLLVRTGCRTAEPGEFTRRAVLAGKMTLSQAEAVADMAEARSETAFRGALARYRGELSSLVAPIAEDLQELQAEIEYNLGFNEREASGVIPKARIHRVAAGLARLIAAAEANRLAVEGANVAIIGRPNAGKSSLFNRLVEGERAITSPVPGTTRDRIDATIVLAGVPVRFVDTAGLTVRAGTHLSRLALAQTRKAVEQADVIIALFDGSRSAGPSDQAVMSAIGNRPAIYALNKADLPRRFDTSYCPARLIPVSCRTGAGIAGLRTRLARTLRAGPGPRLMVNRRQLETLSSCRETLVRAGSAPTLETAALETRSAVDMLSQVDAPTTSTDILNRVFARFCVGK
jgi:tRNA modification GTPase